MSAHIQNYVKYTAKELDQYVGTHGSCVKKLDTTLKLVMFPDDIRGFKKSLLNVLATKKIGSYDHKLNGIILNLRDIKLLGDSCAIRCDDPRIHVNIRTNCYIFQPVVGAIVRGTVRHVSAAQIGVVIYRVFNVSIRLVKKAKTTIELGSEIYLKVKKFNLDNAVPYIEGELVEQAVIKEEKPSDINMLTDEHRHKDMIQLLKEIKEESD